MNKKVEKKLARIKSMIEEIQSMCDCALDDCDEVMKCEDLFIIESQFDRIIRKADCARDVVLEVYDDLEED